MDNIRKTILLVEDEAVVARLETHLLEQEGYHVINAKSGDLAVDIVCSKSEKIDLILMDIDLGDGIDGTEAARLILKEHDIPVLFLSSHTEKEIVEKTEKITSYGYVVKNTGITVLDASIKMAFKLFDAHRNITIQKMEIEAVNEELQATNEEMEASNEELIRSEMLIMEKDELLHLTSRIGRIGGWEFDAVTLTGTWTDEVARIHDLDPGTPTSVDFGISFYAEDSQEKIKNAVKDAVEFGTPYDLELEMVTSAGNHKWVRTIGYPVTQGGRVIKVHGTFQDITERKNTEIEVTRLSRLYEVISQINQLIVHVRERAALLAGACRITVETGRLQMAWIGFVDEEQQAVIPVNWSGVEDGYLTRIKKISISDVPEGRGPTGTAIREGRYFCCNDIAKDPCMTVWREEALRRGYRSSIALPFSINGRVAGSFNIYASEPFFFNDSEIRLLEEVTSDIAYALEVIETEECRKKVQERLDEREMQYRMIAENSIDAIWVMKPDGKITYHSAAVKQLTGFTLEEADNIPLHEIVTSESLDIIRDMIEEDIRKPASLRQNEYLLELEMYRKDKSRIWTEVSVHVNRDSDGNILAFHGSTRDISDLRRTGEELRIMVSQKDILMKELQHRVKNNLNVISNLLSLEAERLPDEESMRIFSNAINRIQSMSVIYERLYLSDDLEQIELNLYIKDLADSIFTAYNIRADNIRLVTSLDNVRLDMRRTVPLGLLLNELITNSLKYAYPAGTDGDIYIALIKEDKKITLSVADEGAGFPDGINPFDTGTMGLMLVKVLARQIGGELIFESRNGTVVSVIFEV